MALHVGIYDSTLSDIHLSKRVLSYIFLIFNVHITDSACIDVLVTRKKISVLRNFKDVTKTGLHYIFFVKKNGSNELNIVIAKFLLD